MDESVGVTLPAQVPDAPAWMQGEALARWSYVVQQLASAGVLALVDQGLLARYCRLWAEWVGCQKVLIAKGSFARGEARPEATMALKLGEQMHRCEGVLGLSPSSRASLKPAEAKKEARKLEALLDDAV